MHKIIEKYQIEKILLIVFTFFLVYNFKIVNIALIALIVFLMVTFSKTKKLFAEFYIQNRFLCCLYAFFVIYQTSLAIWHDDLSDKRVGLLFLTGLIPLALLLTNNSILILKTFLISLVSLVVIGSYNILNYYLTSDTFTLSAGGHIDALLIIARPFLSYMLALGIFISFFLTNIEVKWKRIYFFLPFPFASYLVLIGNRMQVLSLFLISILYFVCYLKLKWYYKLGGVLGGIILFISLFSISDTMQDRFEINSFLSKDIITDLSHKEPRVEIWRGAYDIASDEQFNIIMGLGNKQVLEKKLEYYYNYKIIDNPMKEYFTDSLFNTHNQFIEYYLLSGLTGLLCFILFFATVGFNVKKHFVTTGMVILLFNFCFVENLLDTQLGTYLFGFTVFLIIFINSKLSIDKKML